MAGAAWGIRGVGQVKAPDARLLLLQAHVLKAEDARHGANQLSQSAQRAPTPEACDDGWRRVERIVAEAVMAARLAQTVASELEREDGTSHSARRARRAAERARVAADAAQKLIEERNHAYTFHTDHGFSFGEGWYLAAAGVLAGIAIQIEPGHAGTEAAERFVRDVGLAAQLQPYRPRPRAMKQTTELVARAFLSEPRAVQQRLRAAFLGDEPVPDAVRDWLARRLATTGSRDTGAKKVLVWVRDGVHHAGRNSESGELLELVARARRAGLVPVLIGDALRELPIPEGSIDMILFWKEPLFRQANLRRTQLQFFEELRRRHGLVGQLGVTTAGMDGPALMGLPTLYLTREPNVRMGRWVGAVPGYEELVRDGDYLERVSARLRAWAESPCAVD